MYRVCAKPGGLFGAIDESRGLHAPRARFRMCGVFAHVLRPRAAAGRPVFREHGASRSGISVVQRAAACVCGWVCVERDGQSRGIGCLEERWMRAGRYCWPWCLNFRGAEGVVARGRSWWVERMRYGVVWWGARENCDRGFAGISFCIMYYLLTLAGLCYGIDLHCFRII